MSKNNKQQNYKENAKQTNTVPVAGDLNVSTDCVKKSVGSSKEV